MNNHIQSLPPPSAYSGFLLTHGWGEAWMVDGEASVTMTAMISSNSRPGRVPERSFWSRNRVFGGGGVLECFSEQWSIPPRFLGRKESCSREEVSGAWPRWPHHVVARAGPIRATMWCGPLVAHLHSIFWLRVSPGEIMTFPYFPRIFPKVDFLHKNETPDRKSVV